MNTLKAIAASLGLVLVNHAAAAELRIYDSQALPAAAMAMGSAGAGLSTNFEYLQINPAALGWMPAQFVSFGAATTLLPYDQSMAGAAVAYRDPSFGAFSVGYQQYGITGILNTDSSGNLLGTTELQSKRFNLAFAYPVIAGSTVLGINAKGYSDNYFGNSGQGTAADLGVMSRVLGDHVGIGVAAINIFSQNEIASGPNESDPLKMRFGTSYDLNPVPLRLAVDVTVSDKTVVNGGVEVPIKNLAFRAGYNNNLTLGVGFRLDYITIDYAYLFGNGGLDSGHRLSAVWDFDISSARAAKAAIQPNTPLYQQISLLAALFDADFEADVEASKPLPINEARDQVRMLKDRLDNAKSLGEDSVKTLGWTAARQTAVAQAHTTLFEGSPTPTPMQTGPAKVLHPNSKVYKALTTLLPLIKRDAIAPTVATSLENNQDVQIDDLKDIPRALEAKVAKIKSVDPQMMGPMGYNSATMDALAVVKTFMTEYLTALANAPTPAPTATATPAPTASPTPMPTATPIVMEVKPGTKAYDWVKSLSDLFKREAPNLGLDGLIAAGKAIPIAKLKPGLDALTTQLEKVRKVDPAWTNQLGYTADVQKNLGDLQDLIKTLQR